MVSLSFISGKLDILNFIKLIYFPFVSKEIGLFNATGLLLGVRT